ncbi:putative lipoprotein [Hyalangium minutum]|uniref:Putative lipoprotein n=1 Tax=Hyalangium minutum TaxID=394096 RepID=A0A085WK72_9BACT|nr:putative lipoprotein [Hyalangium minutum]
MGSASNDVRVEVAQLRAEVDRLRAELDEVKGVRRSTHAQSAETGTGGSGSQQEQQPQPIASSMVEGRVSKVSKRSIEVIDSETGEPYVLRLNEDSRARSGQRRIPVTRIRQGSEVRASFDLVAGDTYATQIDVLGKRRR